MDRRHYAHAARKCISKGLFQWQSMDRCHHMTRVRYFTLLYIERSVIHRDSILLLPHRWASVGLEVLTLNHFQGPWVRRLGHTVLLIQGGFQCSTCLDPLSEFSVRIQLRFFVLQDLRKSRNEMVQAMLRDLMTCLDAEPVFWWWVAMLDAPCQFTNFYIMSCFGFSSASWYLKIPKNISLVFCFLYAHFFVTLSAASRKELGMAST